MTSLHLFSHMAEKARIRSDMLRLLKLKCVVDDGDELMDTVLSLPIYQQCRVIAVYVSTRREVSTGRLIEKLFADGKTVLIPSWHGKRMEMIAVGCGQYAQVKDTPARVLLERYGHHIPMPDPFASAPFLGAIDMAIVPALAFHESTLHRIGHGYGHYDRFLAEHPVRWKVGVAFDFQVISHEWVREDHDVGMDIVIPVCSRT